MLVHGLVGRALCWCGGGFLRSCLHSLPAALTLVRSCPRCAAGARWIITIPTFVVVGVPVGAVAGGTVFNIKQRAMSGAEAVPFINFWRALPPLVMEGVRFSFHHAREFSLMVSVKTLQAAWSFSVPTH